MSDRWSLKLNFRSEGGRDVYFAGPGGTELGHRRSDDGTLVLDNSGSWQVYIAPLRGRSGTAGAADPVRVSRQTGMLPTWRADGGELYYQDGPRVSHF